MDCPVCKSTLLGTTTLEQGSFSTECASCGVFLALKENEHRLNLSQIYANIGTWDWVIDTGELYWSERIWALFGHINDAVETSYDNFISAVHPDDREIVQEAVNRCVEYGEEYNIEHRVVWSDGSVHWLHESGNVLRDEEGRPLRMLGVVQDIDSRKRAELALIESENQLKEAKDIAEKANFAKSQFLTNMNHELRTPMNAIIGFAQLMQLDDKNPLSQSQTEYADEILSAGDHLLDLISEVLNLSMIEAGELDIVIEPVDFSTLIDECKQLVAPQAQEQGIEIILMYEGVETTCQQLPQKNCFVLGDKIKLKQALLNILSNAVKYNSPSGKIIIHCEQKHEAIRISVTDTGDGLTEEQQKRLFTPFERLDAKQTPVEGTGIGLVITKNIIELMNGKIGVKSQSEKGCTFWIELPIGCGG